MVTIRATYTERSGHVFSQILTYDDSRKAMIMFENMCNILKAGWRVGDYQSGLITLMAGDYRLMEFSVGMED